MYRSQPINFTTTSTGEYLRSSIYLIVIFASEFSAVATIQNIFYTWDDSKLILFWEAPSLKVVPQYFWINISSDKAARQDKLEIQESLNFYRYEVGSF